jgi:hypothetical protein
VGASTGAPGPSPTLPAPAAIARTVAAGVLLSAAALISAGALVLLVAAVRLGVGGDVRLTFGEASRVLIVSALAIGCTAVLAAPLWSWPARRPSTLGLATILTAVWPLSGVPLPAAAIAIAAVGVALAHDGLTPGGMRATSWPLAGSLALVAVAFAIAGSALADTRPTHPKPVPPAAGRADRRPSEAKAPAAKPPRAGRHSGGKARTEKPSPKKKAPERKAPDDPRIFVAPGLPGSPSPGGPAPSDAPKASDPPRSDTVSATPTPSPTPAPAVNTDGAEAFVRDYYTAIDEQRFDDAWAVLPSAVRAGFDGFDGWKAGFAKTLSNTPNDISATPEGDRVIVRLRLAVLDQGCPFARDFSVTWTLGRPAGEWVVSELRATADGPPPCG